MRVTTSLTIIAAEYTCNGRTCLNEKFFYGSLVCLLIVLATGCTPQNSEDSHDSPSPSGESDLIQNESAEPSPSPDPTPELTPASTSSPPSAEPTQEISPDPGNTPTTATPTPSAEPTQEALPTPDDAPTATPKSTPEASPIPNDVPAPVSEGAASPSPTASAQEIPTNTPNSERTSDANSPEVNKAAAMSTGDLSFSIGGKMFKLNDGIDSVTSVLGDGYEYSEAISCDHEGMDKIYRYDGVEFYTYPDGDADFLNEIILTAPKYKTVRGISVSDSKDKVIAAYGENFEDKDGILIYRCGSGALWFYLSGDTVTSVSLSKD